MRKNPDVQAQTMQSSAQTGVYVRDFIVSDIVLVGVTVLIVM